MINSFATISLDEISALNSAQTLVLTVNNRYARRIIADLSAQLDQTRQVMALPDVVPVSAWLRRAADQLSFNADAPLASHTVDTFGSQYLWQQVIAEAEADHVLLDVTQAARLAIDADRLLSEWQLTVDPHDETSDYQRFKVWKAQYRDRLLSLDAEDANLGAERVIEAFIGGAIELPVTTLVLAGFNELSPRIAGLLGALHQQGIELRVLRAVQPVAENVLRIAAPDPDAEWRLAAQWAAGQLQQNPQGQFAIVAAQLESDVAFVHRVLGEALGEARLPYNVAVARPLVEWPLVRAAIAWLRVLSEFARKGTCKPAMAGEALLAGACVGDVSESSGRAAIDALWRKWATVSVSAEAFDVLLKQMAPRLAEAWGVCLADASQVARTAPIDVWVLRFRKWLHNLGFPGQSTLDSHAFQVAEAFDGSLGRLSRQAAVLGDLGFGSAVSALQRLAGETPFQPQRDPASRLDVLGLLESEGGRWDAVWVLGLTDEVLPATPKPNPLIPLATLRRANAPRATPERELQWAKAMHASLLCSAASVWFSHAMREGERELRPSPTIASLPALEQLPQEIAHPACALDLLVDDQGPALQEGVVTTGGIGVIDTQSRNPLWAFVKYRLGASEMKDYAELSDQNARGLLLHRAIELVWRLIPDQEALQRLQADGSLPGLVEQAVRQAADECLQDYGNVLRALETERAIEVISNWLLLELTREPFRVRDVEQTYQWARGPLNLTLRLDRIDELSDGRLAVIDYKSGNGSIDPKSNWMRPRPVGLQLPFYAAVLGDGQTGVAALVLAKLHARKIEVKGLADADYGFHGLASLRDWPEFADYTWLELMARWRATIEELAREYSMGVATNESLRREDLEYCDVLPFLRLHEEIQIGE